MSVPVDALDLPSWQAAANARTLLGPLLRAAYRIRIQGADRVPARGPLLLAAGHPGAIDPLLLAAMAPRPVHVVADAGPWPEPLDRWARAVGEITVDAAVGARRAVHQATAALADDRAVAVFPEGGVSSGTAGQALPLAGLLLARTGAPVLPVAILGTRGRHVGDPPRLRTAVDVVFGAPVTLAVGGIDPLRRIDVLRLAETVRQVLADHVAAVARRTGRQPVPGVPEDGGWTGASPEPTTRGPRT